jgi:membrane-associated protease RseP (regulator of RpoE activity)
LGEAVKSLKPQSSPEPIRLRGTGRRDLLLRASSFDTSRFQPSRALQVTADALSPNKSGPGVRLSGPLGLKQASDQAVRNASDWEEPFPVLYLAAWLSLAVAMTNLLPLPALDGGRILLVTVETIRSQQMDPKVEKWVHALGMVCLLVLTLALTVRDVMDPLF